MANSDYKVAFIGLPSSGKSTIINSLIGKRLLVSGICRTTTEYKELEEYIEDDNDNKFKVIDLPGICDSEESDTNFNELTNEHIKDANLIIWTSDVNKAFITTHEVNEYNRIQEYIFNLNNDTGKLYYLIICLSKCDKDISDKKSKTKKKSRKSNEEISESDEDTDLVDMINKVKEKFPNEDIIHFNAFGRSYYHKNSSSTLKKFIQKNGIPLKNNIRFDITKYIKNYKTDQEIEYNNIFQIKYQSFINNKININELLKIYDKLNDSYKNNHLNKICEESFNTNLRIYQFIKYIYDYIDYYSYFDNRIHNRLIDYYFYILHNNNLYSFANNYVCTYTTDTLIDEIIHSFINTNKNYQTDLYNKLLFEYSLPNYDCSNRINIINKIHDGISDLDDEDGYIGNRYDFDFDNNFNKFIKSTDRTNFNRFYNVMKGTINIIDYKFEYNICNQTPKEIFNNYINFLEDISADDEYILLNKLEILGTIINNHENILPTHNHCSYYKIIKSFEYIPLNRLIHNDEWNKINNEIWKRIYSNIKVDFDYSDWIHGFTPIDISELLYELNDENDNKSDNNNNNNNGNSDNESYSHLFN